MTKIGLFFQFRRRRRVFRMAIPSERSLPWESPCSHPFVAIESDAYARSTSQLFCARPGASPPGAPRCREREGRTAQGWEVRQYLAVDRGIPSGVRVGGRRSSGRAGETDDRIVVESRIVRPYLNQPRSFLGSNAPVIKHGRVREVSAGCRRVCSSIRGETSTRKVPKVVRNRSEGPRSGHYIRQKILLR